RGARAGPRVPSWGRATPGASGERIPALERVATGSSSRDPLPLASSPPTTHGTFETSSEKDGTLSRPRAIPHVKAAIGAARTGGWCVGRALRPVGRLAGWA